MLEKPPIADEIILACINEAYGLQMRSLAFLALGADVNTAVYRAIDAAESAYFVKLRRANFDANSLIVPSYLHEQGIMHIIAPIKTVNGGLWVSLAEGDLSLSPFIVGRNGFETSLTDAQWATLGDTLKRIHSLKVPSGLDANLQKETFSDHFRRQVRHFQQMAADTDFHEPISAKLANLLRNQYATIRHLIERAGYLATLLRTDPPDFVLCHADIHAGNVLLDEKDNLYVVDWDTIMLAPKERDLMFIGGGIGRDWSHQHGINQFYEGYGSPNINPIALAYYRYERIVEDIAAYCEQIWLSDGGDADRAEGLGQLTGQFAVGDVIDIACQTNALLPPEHRQPRP